MKLERLHHPDSEFTTAQRHVVRALGGAVAPSDLTAMTCRGAQLESAAGPVALQLREGDWFGRSQLPPWLDVRFLDVRRAIAFPSVRERNLNVRTGECHFVRADAAHLPEICAWLRSLRIHSATRAGMRWAQAA